MNRLQQQGTEEAIFLRLPEVKTLTGLSKSSLYALIRARSFPAPIRLGPRTVAWVKSEIKEWAAERILSGRTATLLVDGKRKPLAVARGTWFSSRSA